MNPRIFNKTEINNDRNNSKNYKNTRAIKI